MSANRCRSKTIGINPSPDIINPQCSCPQCDSMSCFAKRHSSQPCTCDKCNNSKTCLFYTNNNVQPDESQPYANIDANDNQEIDNNQNLKELIKKEYIYEYDKNTNTRTVTKKQSKFFYRNEGSKFEEYDKTEITQERPPTQVHSVSIKYSRKEVNPSTAKLSAQVMDVPYKDFQNSISYNRSDVSEYKTAKLSKTDIFTRIKEAYKACSCKVCECIVGSSFIAKPDSCKCKPCECNDCVSFTKNIHHTDIVKCLLSDGFPCTRCSRNQCKDPIKNKFKEPQICDCKPCECIECCDSFSKSCNCESCQCVECKSMAVHSPRTLVVAPMREKIHHNTCQCSPCDCIECQHVFELSSSLRHEMSTSINRHPHCHCETCQNDACEPDGSESCKCERRSKVMTKPIEKQSQDYDIRTLLTNNNYSRHYRKKSDTNDTIAMFASLSNTYPTLNSASNNNVCRCNDCECLVCKSEENAANSIKSSQLFNESVTIQNLPNANFNHCICSPCECHICSINRYDMQETVNILKEDCDFEAWDCSNYGKSKAHNSKNIDITQKIGELSSRAVCKCNPCKCVDCDKDMITCSGDICHCNKCSCLQCFDDFKENYYPIKKGELLTPSIYKVKVDHGFDIYHKAKGIMNISDLPRTSQIDLNCNTSQKQLSTDTLRQNDFLKNKTIKRVCSHASKKESQEYADYPKQYKSDVFKWDAHKQYHEENIVTHVIKNREFINNVSEANLYGNISIASTSKSSYSKENEIISPNSKVKHISWKSSCNSSSRDSSNYLIQFPKTTVETCIHDVMKFNLENNLRSDRLNFGSKRNLVHFNNTPCEMDALLGEPKHFRKSCYPQMVKTVSGNQNISVENSDNDYNELNFKYHNNHGHRKQSFSRSSCVYETDVSHNNINIQTNKTSDNLLQHRKYDGQNINNQRIKSLTNDRDAFESSHPNKNVTNTTISEGYCTWKNYKRPLHSNTENNKIFNIDPDYERVQKTLRDARAFSLHLMTILEKYEKANREFESISGKLKLSNEAFPSGSVKEISADPKTDSGLPQNVYSMEKETKYEPKEMHLDFSENPMNDKQVLELAKFKISEQQVNLNREIIGQHFKSAVILENGDVNLPAATIEYSPDILQFDISTSNEDMEQSNKINGATIQKDNDIISNNATNLDAVINREVMKTAHMKQINNTIAIQPDEISRTVEQDSHSQLNFIVTENIGEIESHHTTILNHEQSCNIENVEKKNVCTLHNGTKLNVAKNSSKETPQAMKSNERRSKKQYKKSKKLSNHSTFITKIINEALGSKSLASTSVATETDTVVPIADKDDEQVIQIKQTKHKIHDSDQIMKKMDPVSGTTEVIKSSLAHTSRKTRCNDKANTTLEETAGILETEQIEGLNLWSVMKKNHLLDSDPIIMNNREVCMFPLQNEVKETVQSISLQTSSAYNKRENKIIHKNKALQKLQVEVKKLLNLPLLQPKINKEDEEQTMDFQPKAELESKINDRINMSVLQPVMKKCTEVNSADSYVDADTRLPSIGSSKSSCDTFKVSFLGLRKVSDHTVLVKWNVPQALAEVQGYELLVDGRAVQKIFSPSRSMAVVTCLPHCDKILLTIRTITATISDIGHYPSATIVYRPRVKC